jgi:hypothetical protein
LIHVDKTGNFVNLFRLSALVIRAPPGWPSPFLLAGPFFSTTTPSCVVHPHPTWSLSSLTQSLTQPQTTLQHTHRLIHPPFSRLQHPILPSLFPLFLTFCGHISSSVVFFASVLSAPLPLKRTPIHSCSLIAPGSNYHLPSPPSCP